jgi:hypothetical protein
MDTHTVLHIAHLLVLGPALVALGAGYLSWVPRMYVAAVGAFIVLYHAYRAYSRAAAGGYPWVNLIHVLFVGPALIAYGYSDARYISELIMMLGFAAIGYHAYYLIV